MRVIIGSDHAGVLLKKQLVAFLYAQGHEVVDCGTYNDDPIDYPDVAEKVALEVKAQGLPGILVCGTGIGVSIAANKVPGIRAALCHDLFTAQLARQHNDANIVSIGARITGPGLAEAIVKTFLETDFMAGRHQARVEKIMALEKKYGERV